MCSLSLLDHGCQLFLRHSFLKIKIWGLIGKHRTRADSTIQTRHKLQVLHCSIAQHHECCDALGELGRGWNRVEFAHSSRETNLKRRQRFIIVVMHGQKTMEHFISFTDNGQKITLIHTIDDQLNAILLQLISWSFWEIWSQVGSLPIQLGLQYNALPVAATLLALVSGKESWYSFQSSTAF